MKSKKAKYIAIGVLVLVLFFVSHKGNEVQESSSQKDKGKQDIVINNGDNKDSNEDTDKSNLVVGEDEVQENNTIEFEELEKTGTDNQQQNKDKDAADKTENSNTAEDVEDGNGSTSTDKLNPAEDTSHDYGPIT